jgi:outer membrane protein assembly factor BamB
MDFAPRDLSGGPQWTFTTGGGILSSPAIANGKLYIGSNDKVIYCLDAYSGQEIWNWSFPANDTFMTHFGSTPAVLGSEVIIGPDDGNVYALDGNTGKELWAVNTGPYVPLEISAGQNEIRSSPIIYDGNIYVGSEGGNFYCISSSGSVLWSHSTGGPIIS